MLKFQGKVTDTSGNPVPGAQLTVTKTNVITPLPVIYTIASDGSIFASANPFNSDSNGEYVFAVESGSYSIEATGSAAVLNISKTITQFDQQPVAEAVPVAFRSAVYTTNSSWTAPAGVTQVTVTCVAGGAGGQAGSVGTVGGVGGGAGATVWRTLPITPGTTHLILVGAGGTGGVAPGGLGTDGGDSSFGSLVLAYGGLNSGVGGRGTTLGFGGTNALTVPANSSWPVFYGRGGVCAGGDGGAGGTVGGTLTAVDGWPVESFPGGVKGAFHVPAVQTVGGGGGGSSAFGPGGDGGGNDSGAAAGSAGSTPASGYGGGGGGGAEGSASGGAGGAGKPGLCIVEWIS